MSGSQNFCGSFMIPVTMFCIVMFEEYYKTEFVTGKKKFKRESLVY
jgi:hypothetical protein